MRVLLVNAFHWLKGGVERTYLDESRWLTAAGHDVAHMATQHPQNLPSPTSEFFAPFADYGETASLGTQLDTARLAASTWLSSIIPPASLTWPTATTSRRNSL